MKTTIKITALAVLVALAVFSCAPEAELTSVDWKKVNTEYDSGKNSDYTTVVNGFSVTENRLATGADEANEVTITFPANSDFLRTAGDSKIASGLKQFLSFYHFTKTEVPVAGKADTLGPALPYKFVRRDANTVTVKLDKTFVVDDSTVIMKINGTKYTFAGGNKLDLVNRGRSGQAGYDDLYFELPVATVTGPSGFTGLAWAGGTGIRGSFNQGWTLTLDTISAPPSDKIEAAEYRIARLVLTGPAGAPADVSAITRTVADQLKGGLKIQELVNGSWGNVNATVNFIIDENNNNAAIFYVPPLTLKDLVPVRVMWDRAAPVTTSAEYFGVKQYIAIIGDNAYTAPSYYRTAKVYGAAGEWYNTYDGRRFSLDEDSIKVVNLAKDYLHQNVVLEVLINNGEGIPGDGTTYWLKNFNNDKQKFKDNFKIAYYDDMYNRDYPPYPYYYSYDGSWQYLPNVSHFASRPDVRYITIKDVEFFRYNPYNAENVGLNAIRITLDPAYKDAKIIYFYISPEIRYDDDKTTFGDADNYLHGFFKAYGVKGFTQPVPPPTYPWLTENVWMDGNIATGGEQRFSFIATAYTQYIHIAFGSLDDMYVQLYDSNGVSVGDPSNLYRSAVSMSQNVTPGQIYTIRVWPYYYSNSGTYQIAFNDSATRP